jgi:hypothetical protein
MKRLKVAEWYNRETIPTFSSSRLTKRRDCIERELLSSGMYKDSITHKNLDKLKERVFKHISKPADPDHKRNTVSAIGTWLVGYLDSKLDDKTIREIAIIGSGWNNEFCNGYPFVKWKVVRGVWASLYCEDISRSLLNRNLLYDCVFEVQNGPASGVKLDKIMSADYCRHFIRSVVGVINRNKPAIELGGLYLTGWLNIDKGKVLIDPVFASYDQKEINNSILAGREDFCAGGYKAGRVCTEYCPYGRDICKYARHKNTYRRGRCANTVFTHNYYICKNGYCIYCMINNAFKTTEEEKQERDLHGE